MEKGGNSFGIASVILGILSTVLFFTILPSIILGVTGIIFGLIQRKRSKNNWAIYGIVMSIIGIILSILIFIYFIGLVGDAKTQIDACLANPELPGCEELLKLVQ
jgi:disulfide bond formation protein DsbB